jgi:hypothetical protein
MNFFENTPIHENSIKAYNAKLNEWISFMPSLYQSLVCVINFPDISMKALENNLKSNTNTNRHLYIVAVMSFIKHNKDLLIHLSPDQYSVIRIKWIDINNQNEAPIIQRRLENKPTDNQLKKGGFKITFSQIIAKRDELPLGSVERLLIAMYTMIPPVRADYFATQIIRGDEVPTQKNYIRIYSPDRVESILTDFKTAKTFKQITNLFPPQLITELNSSLDKYPRSYLFTNTKGQPYTRNSFTVWASRLLSKLFETEFTLVFFRHSFVSHFISQNVTDSQIAEASQKMGHSPEMFRAYRWIKEGNTDDILLTEEDDEKE